MYGLRTHDAAPSGVIVQPTRERKHGHSAYRFVFSGFGRIYIVSSHSAPAPLAAAFLTPNGRTIVSLVDLYAAEWMASFARERRKRGQAKNPLLL